MTQRKARATAVAEPFDYAAQFDTPDTEELTLSTGRKLRVQQPDMALMARKGLIPNHILPIVEKFVIGNNLVGTFNEFAPAIRETDQPGAALVRTAELNEYIDVFCIAAVADPRLSEDGKEGTTKVSKLTRQERFEVWDWGVGLTQAIQRFREYVDGALASVADAPAGENLRDATERGDGADQPAVGVAGVPGGHGDGESGSVVRSPAGGDEEAGQETGPRALARPTAA